MKKLWLVLFVGILSLLITATACEKKVTIKALEQRTYVYEDSDDIIKPNVTLKADNRFQFNFSPLSSYIGFGTYSLDGNTLVLHTDDDNYRYTFKIVEGKSTCLVFDAEDSSENIHFADFSDGSVFK